MDDALAELNRMASNAELTATDPNPPTEEDITRWTTLFSYTRPEAQHLITTHRADITRDPIPLSHWEIIRPTLEPLGHNLESYEHSLNLKDVLHANSTVVYDTEGKKWWVIRLGGLLGSREKVRDVAGLKELPRVEKGVGGGGREVEFVWVDEGGKGRVDKWIDEQRALGGR